MTKLSAEAYAIVEGRHSDPFHYLGLHIEGDKTVVRAFLPEASNVEAIGEHGEAAALARIHDAGLFARALPNGSRRYQLRARFGETVGELDDPYRLPPGFSHFDLYLVDGCASRAATSGSGTAVVGGRAAPARRARRRYQRARRADVDLRGPPRLVAAEGPQRMADLSRPGGAASELCPRSRLHPHRIFAGQRTPVRRLVGLSADRPVRADQPIWRARRFFPSGGRLPPPRPWRE